MRDENAVDPEKMAASSTPLAINYFDIACRVGGEEFLLILPDTSLDITRERAEKLREAIKRVNIQYGGRPLGAITLSMGVVVLPVHGTTSEVILRSADEALYQAKAQGRDRVVVAKPIQGAP